MSPILIPATVLFAAIVLGVLGLRPFSYRVRITIDTICFLVISSLLFAQRVSPVFPPLPVAPDSDALWLRALGGAWWLLGARIIVAILWFALQRNGRSREARLFFDLTTAVIYVAATVMVLNSVLALPVTGLLATSGVLAILLGLALQNTLADVFAGIAVGIEGPFTVGDRIQIGDRIEGQVVQVNWRSIRVQTDGDDVAIVPNSVIAKAEIVNRSFPSQRRAASVELSCPKSALPERVIEVLLRSTLLCPDILRTPAPSAVLTRLGRTRNDYKIMFFVESTKQLTPTKDQLLRGAHRQLHYAGFLDNKRQKEAPGAGETAEARAARRLLSELVLFECLSEQQIGALADRLEPRRLESGEVLFEQGATDASLYILASGVIEFTRREEAVSETIGCIGAGEYVGEIGLLTGAAHAATATTRTYCQVYRLPNDALTPLLEQNKELAAALDKSARRGLGILHREIVARATPNISGRGQLLARILSFFRSGPA
jgi:small-conductance mechanosensitive channel/CRP-like cAMP-binding protein